jgi:coenzyme F420-reducing hydrogenase delta subunit
MSEAAAAALDAAQETNTGPEGGDGGDGGDVTPPSANTWWQFETKDAAEEWANNLIQKRLTRDRKTNLEPLQQTNATLEAEVNRLREIEASTMTEAQRIAAKAEADSAELEQLRAFKQSRERQELVNEIAEEAGLDPKFLKFVDTSGTADEIQQKITDLLNALSEGGSNTGKRTPATKAPKEPAPQGNPAGTGKSGGGGSDGESDDALIADILAETAKIRKNGGIRFA